ncbi:uncharacterized protein LOC144625086 [Crassostrea virginica]
MKVNGPTIFVYSKNVDCFPEVVKPKRRKLAETETGVHPDNDHSYVHTVPEYPEEHVLWKQSPNLKKYKEATLTIVMLFPNQGHPEKVLLIWHKKWKTSKER